MKVSKPVSGRTLCGHIQSAEIRELGLNSIFLSAIAISDKIIRFKIQI